MTQASGTPVPRFPTEPNNQASGLAQYQQALQLAHLAVKSRNRVIRALTAFTYQSGRLTSLDAVLKLGLNRALEITDSPIGAIILVNNESRHQQFELVVARNLPGHLEQTLSGELYEANASALMPHLVLGHAALLEDSAAADPEERSFLQANHLSSLASLPLQVGSNLLGALLVGKRNQQTLAPADLYFLIGLSQEIAAAYDRIQLRENLWEMAEKLLSTPQATATEAEAAPAMTQRPTLTPVQARLLEIINAVSGSMGAIYCFHPRERRPKASLIAHHGLSLAFTGPFGELPLLENRFPFPDLLERNLLIHDLSQAIREKPYSLLVSLQEEGAESLLARTVGHLPDQQAIILLVAAPTKGAFEPSHMADLQALGQSLSTLIATEAPPPVTAPLPDPSPTSPNLLMPEKEEDLEALLGAMMDAEEEVQRHSQDLAALNDISEHINRSLNLDEILSTVTDKIGTLLQVEAIWIYLVDYSNEQHPLELKAHTGLSERYIRGRRRINRLSDIEGQVVLDNQAFFIEDLTQYEGHYPLLMEHEQFQAVSAVPMARPRETLVSSSEPQVLGVLACAHRQAHAWSTREGWLMRAIANQMALAVNNAQLFTQVRDSMAMLAASNEVLQEINKQLIESQVNLEKRLNPNEN